MKQNTKCCIFCTVRIPRHFITCRKHYALYNHYKHELWCQELVQSENKQANIDMLECITTDIFSTDLLSDMLGRNYSIATRDRVMEKRKAVYHLRHIEKLTSKQIAQRLGLTHANVRKILQRLNNGTYTLE